MFVYVGKDVTKDQRKKALIIGEDFIRANKVRDPERSPAVSEFVIALRSSLMSRTSIAASRAVTTAKASSPRSTDEQTAILLDFPLIFLRLGLSYCVALSSSVVASADCPNCARIVSG